MSEKRGFVAWLKHAFSMEGYNEPFTEREIALLDRQELRLRWYSGERLGVALSANEGDVLKMLLWR